MTARSELPRYMKRSTRMGLCIALGAGLGVVFGAATKNSGVGLALGVALGVAIGAALVRRSE